MEKMSIKMDDEVRQRTTHCEHDFSCLSGDKTCLCEAKSSMGYDMLDIKPKFAIDCRYHISFGETDFCTCPIRNELYKRHSI